MRQNIKDTGNMLRKWKKKRRIKKNSITNTGGSYKRTEKNIIVKAVSDIATLELNHTDRWASMCVYVHVHMHSVPCHWKLVRREI